MFAGFETKFFDIADSDYEPPLFFNVGFGGQYESVFSVLDLSVGLDSGIAVGLDTGYVLNSDDSGGLISLGMRFQIHLIGIVDDEEIKLFYAGPSVIYYNEVQESLGILLRASYLVDTEYDVLSNFSLSAGLTYQM